MFFRLAMNKVRDFISDHFGVSQLYLTHPTFFSRLDSKPASTVHDEYWHIHVDRETYPNFHYTSLLYLTDFGVDFSGGEFVFVDSHDKLNRYPSGLPLGPNPRPCTVLDYQCTIEVLNFANAEIRTHHLPTHVGSQYPLWLFGSPGS